MEALGRTEYGFIISIERDELAKLCGSSSGYSKIGDVNTGSITNGTKLEIGTMYESAYKIIKAFNEAKTGLERLKTNSEVLLGFVEERT